MAVGRLILEGRITRFGQLFKYMTITDWANVFKLTNRELKGISKALSNVPIPVLLRMVRPLHIKPSMLIELFDGQKVADQKIRHTNIPSNDGSHATGRNVHPLYCPICPTGQIFPVSVSTFMAENLSIPDKRHNSRSRTKR